MNDQVIEVYKVMVNSAEKVSDRRQVTNNFYGTLSSAIIAAIGLAFNAREQSVLAYLFTVGLVSATAWLLHLWKFTQLNSAKFKLILELEKSLPFQPFTKESVTPSQFLRFSWIEALVPIILLFGYCTLLVLRT
jgi:hypothetical protein